MRRNDDDRTSQSKDAEREGDAQPLLEPAPGSYQPASDPHTEVDPGAAGHLTARSNESDEEAYYAGSQISEPEPWPGLGDDPLEVSDQRSPSAPPKRKTRKRRLIAGIALLLISTACLLAFYYTFRPSQSVKVNITARQPSQTQDATAKPDKASDDVTAEAIAEVRSAMSNLPTGGPTSGSVISVPRGAENLAAPLSSSVLPPDAAPSDKPIETKHEVSGRDVSRRNQEQSIRFPADEGPAVRKVSLNSPPTEAASLRPDKTPSDASRLTVQEALRSPRPKSVATASRNISTRPSVAPVVLPSFGSVIPVRTLGKIYTLRSGSTIRLELTRYVSGEGWSLSKGTVLLGQVRGSERDRAFIAITGFIEPSRGRFVNLSGEVLGDDGGSGIRGKFHKLSSGWSRAFSRVGSAAVNVAGAIAGSRISGQPVIITDIGSRTVSPFSYELDSALLQQNRGFVEVPAGTPGFVMVTTLPADVKGVDAEPDRLAESSEVAAAKANQPGTLTDEELAALLASGDMPSIREALPRMSPQTRRIAEILLAEASQKQPDRE
jgi:hypothetical protein